MKITDSFENGMSGHTCHVYTPDGYYTTERGEVNPPVGWNVWYYHAPPPVPHDPENTVGYAEPETRLSVHRPHTGTYGYLLFTFYRIHRAGMYKQISVNVGDSVTADAFAHAWSSSDNDPATSDGVGAGPFFALEGAAGLSDAQRNFTFKLGIDPTGGIDPFAETVVWGSGAHIYNVYAAVPQVFAVAKNTTVTIFLADDVLWPLVHCDAYWDDVSINITVPEPPGQCPIAREFYERTYALIPPGHNSEWAAVLAPVIDAHKITVGFSADDAFIYVTGLGKRTVFALNPEAWNGDLTAFWQQWYPTISNSQVEYIPIYADTPQKWLEGIEEYYDVPPESPPTSSTKIGPHILRSTSDIALTYGAPVVKLVGDWGLASNFSGLIIGRKAIDDPIQGDYIAGKTPHQAAVDFMATQAETIEGNPLIKWWEGPNEPVFTTIDGMAWYAQFEIERMILMESVGKKCVIGNFSTGVPSLDIGWWDAFLPAVRYGLVHDAILGLHEYSCPWMWWMTGNHQINPGDDEGDEGWTTLRYRKVYRQYLEPAGLGAMPLVITECGIDPGVNPRPPGTPAGTWKQLGDFWAQNDGRPDTARYYYDQLMWYENELKKDPFVLGAVVFTWGNWGGTWQDFDIAETEVAQLLGAHWAELPEPEPPSGGPIPYSQRDPRWKSKRLLPSACTMGNRGCLVTAVGIRSSEYEPDITPGDLCDCLCENEGFNNDGGLLFYVVQQCLPWMRFRNYVLWNNVADMSIVEAALERGSTIIKVDYDPGDPDVDSHFVFAAGWTDSGHTDLHIIDPWTGEWSTLMTSYPSATLAQSIKGLVDYEIVPTAPTTLIGFNDCDGPSGSASQWMMEN